MTIDDKQTAQSLGQGVQRIWLVRHGQTAWNEQGRFCGHTDIPLSEAGRKQAHKLAAQLQNVMISAIYSSDLSRARETAEIIGNGIRLKDGEVQTPIITSPTLREINFGAWEGLTYDEIATTFPEELGFFTNPEFISPPQGETLVEVLQRVLPALRDFIRHRHDRAVVVVSHEGILRGLLCSLLDMPLRNQWQLRINTGSLSAIDVSLDEHGKLLASLVGLNIVQM